MSLVPEPDPRPPQPNRPAVAVWPRHHSSCRLDHPARCATCHPDRLRFVVWTHPQRRRGPAGPRVRLVEGSGRLVTPAAVNLQVLPGLAIEHRRASAHPVCSSGQTVAKLLVASTASLCRTARDACFVRSLSAPQFTWDITSMLGKFDHHLLVEP